MRTMQVLGQVLKNFPGSLTAAEKFNIVNEVFGLGLRGLGFILNSMEEGEEELVKFFAERIARKSGADPADRKLQAHVKRSLFSIIRLIVFGMVKLVSQSVGSEGEEKTYSEVVKSINSTAARLIDISIDLDTLKIPKKKLLALQDDVSKDIFNKDLLTSLVMQHLYLYRVPSNVKDELRRRFDIRVETVNTAEWTTGAIVKRV